MSAANTTNNKLQWDVLTIKRPGLSRDLPAGKEELMWVANSSTLISGERDAVLVDTFLTTGQSQILLDWVFSRPSVRGLPPSGCGAGTIGAAADSGGLLAPSPPSSAGPATICRKSGTGAALLGASGARCR